MLEKTAILFFSRTLKDEFKSKSFGLGLKHFTRLYRLLKGRTLTEARASGLLVIESYSDSHKGDSFAEKLINELSVLKQKGFESAIVIGNDTPELTSNDILSAADYLKLGEHVVGRDKRGGAFLIGLNLKKLELNNLLNVSWQTRSVATELGSMLEARFLIKDVQDINSRVDIAGFSRKCSGLSSGFIKLLKLLLEKRVFGVQVPNSKQFWEASELTILRGPPSPSTICE